MRPIAYNAAQCGDALELLQALLAACSPLVFFDPQYPSPETWSSIRPPDRSR